MYRLASLLFSIIASALAGTGVVVALVAGYATLIPLLAAAAIGFVLALPVTYFIARAIVENG